MSGWNPGDLALCIGQSGWMKAATGLDADGPRPGSIYVVRAVYVIPEPKQFLIFAEFPRQGFDHTAFVKVTPDEELIAEERKAGVPA